ncbi:MAG TPA: dihydroorotate dehydrogenase-like protein [Opitutaceae bacterium]|nr:dihydroorotate dehydrogenase-like protein [Opitutaceae bacterium]HND61977.1 dihydroorotate dehydrogenase-like protein [Opitutaceae bacterium]
MDLTTTYLGLKLSNPIVIGASPFSDNTHVARQLQDSGAAAVVMRSLFEEQIDAEQRALRHHVETPAESNPEATSFFPNFAEYQLVPDHYLRQIEDLKRALTIPVIASLNGTNPGGWTNYAKRCESAGADAIELNLYQLATDPSKAADDLEADMLETVGLVLGSVKIPVAVKLSPFHTAPAHFALALERMGAKGVVLFNRFYQPDFDVEELEVAPQLKLSDSSELLLRLRWLAVLSPHLKGSLAASGGVHSTRDMVKALLAGAHAVQVVSVLLKNGPRLLTTLLAGLRTWMEEHGYENVDEFRGAMNLARCPDPGAFERANYQKILQSWRV